MNTSVNIETIENKKSYTNWLVLSSENKNKVGECLDTIKNIYTSFIFVFIKSVNVSGHIISF